MYKDTAMSNGVQPGLANWQGHALLWIFAASGFSGLIYQSIWTQYLGLFLGHSARAQSLVLMLFMGGMALGAWLVSRGSESMRRPLLAYAAIELAIGVMGLLFDPGYQAATAWVYDSLMPATGGHPAVRWSVAVAMVLPQCILLGATFPLMSAGFMRLQPTAEGRILSGLYFSNSIGAAVGALAAIYFLLPSVGLPGAMLSAGLVNILVAIAVYPIGKQEAHGAVVPDRARSAGMPAVPLLVLVVAALTGASSFVYEITWVRMLSLALGTTIHAFELMLASFIAGIAFGGLWLRQRADRLQSPLAMAGWVQVGMGIAALGSMFVYAHAFEWVGWLLRVIARTDEGYSLYNLASGAISLLVMFPTAFFAGMTLPLLTLALLREGGGERVIGHAYAANTLGAIAGVLLAVHVLLPMLGLKLALTSAACIDLGLGLVLVAATRQPRAAARLRAPALAALLSLGALGLSLWRVDFDPLVLASSVYRHGTTVLTDTRMLYYRDGKTATVAVYERGRGKDARRSIATNGKVDAGLIVDHRGNPGTDEFTMALAAALPLSMRPGFERVGVIGLGSGMTSHVLLGSQRVGQVDTVEIEPAIVEGARTFGARVSRVYEDPRSRIVIDDAKAYFSSSSARYDLIISEPSNPWVGGTATLFSQEFYRFIPRHLRKDGLFVQWLQLYEIDPTLVSSVLQAMLPHFSDVQAYLANDGDLLLVATPSGRVPPPGSRVFADAALQGELVRLGYTGVRDLQDAFLMDRRALAAYAGIHPARANSDFFPILQLNSPVTRFTNRHVNLGAVHAAPWPISRQLAGIPARDAEHPPPTMKRPLALDAKQKTALTLRAILRDGAVPADGIAPALGYQAQALRALGSSCRLEAAPARSLELLFALAGESLPFLDRDSQDGLWHRPAWQACTSAGGPVSEAMALLDASSQDDHAGVIRHARALLDGPQAALVTTSEPASRYVAGAMLHAAMAMRDAGLTRRLYAAYWENLHPSTRQDTVVLLMLALAANPER